MIMRNPRSAEGAQLLSASYPKFEPHITLASFLPSSTPSLPAIRTALSGWKADSVPVEFQSIDVGTHFFRSVYIAIAPTSTISALHEHIHTTLGVEPRTPSFPHLSLCYISDEDAQSGERGRFLRELEAAGKVERVERDERVRLNCGGPGEVDWLAGFQAGEVWVADCDGPVEGWSVLDVIPITSVPGCQGKAGTS